VPSACLLGSVLENKHRYNSSLSVDHFLPLAQSHPDYIEPKPLMKKLIAYAMTALIASIAVSFAAPDKEAILAKEKAAWQAFKDKKPDDFKKVVDKDFRGAYAEGISDMDKELSDMKKWDMKSFTISEFNALSDEPDVIVTTYVVKIEGTFGGKDASGSYNAGSVWKQEKGAWLAIFHTNVKAETAAK
jgi:hypothetical protein